ncbi:N-acetyltransferase [Tardiphaga alba]|uniref:N-acetyltransferase n=1 Tax=Tardiphaga alba TaxID=340268 RepID=A0ABX8A9H5_9BRAD|nr:GNAT family N-acetyltransferase [Tardiphaga alba]QUS39093.1 N-acetyltransferase [Tardiphaga alba]
MLRPAMPDDAPVLSAWLSDPTINRYLTSNLRGIGLSAQLVKIALRRTDQCWYVFTAHDAPIGLVALDSIDNVDGVANLWFLLGDHRFARSGVTSAAIRQFCATNPPELAVAMAWAAAPNIGSHSCLRRAGFAEIGRIENAVSLPEGRFARYLYARDMGAST